MPIESLSQIIENAFNIDFNTFVAVSFSTAIVALLIVFVIRWLGNKGMGQLSTIEMNNNTGIGRGSRSIHGKSESNFYPPRIYSSYYSNSNIQNL